MPARKTQKCGDKKTEENTPVWKSYPGPEEIFPNQLDRLGQSCRFEKPESVVIKKLKENTPVRRKFFWTGLPESVIIKKK